MAQNSFNSNQSNKSIHKEKEKAIIVGIIYKEQTEERVTEFLDELEFLAMTAGCRCKKALYTKAKPS